MSPRRLPSLTPQQVIRALQRGGFSISRVRGGHYLLKSADGSRRVTVPFHRKSLKPGTLHAIVHDSGLTPDEFVDLL